MGIEYCQRSPKGHYQKKNNKHTCTVGAEFAKQLSGFGLEQMSTVLRLGRKLRILREPLNQVLWYHKKSQAVLDNI